MSIPLPRISWFVTHCSRLSELEPEEQWYSSLGFELKTLANENEPAIHAVFFIHTSTDISFPDTYLCAIESALQAVAVVIKFYCWTTIRCYNVDSLRVRYFCSLPLTQLVRYPIYKFKGDTDNFLQSLQWTFFYLSMELIVIRVCELQ